LQGIGDTPECERCEQERGNDDILFHATIVKRQLWQPLKISKPQNPAFYPAKSHHARHIYRVGKSIIQR
jgi:hypothetical protein